MPSSPDRDDLTAVFGSFTPGRRRNNWTATAAPTATDDEDAFYEPGSRWLDTTTGTVYTLVDSTAGAAVWSSGGGGATDHGALTGLTDDDHEQYALMESQAADPGAPVRPEAFWYDTDATPDPLDYGEDADITTLDYGDTPDAGASDEIARADHRHGMPASGAIDWGETADIVTQAYSDSPDAGVLDEAARADHRHGMPGSGGVDFGEVGDIAALAFGNAPAAGSTGEVADAGHVHGMPATPGVFSDWTPALTATVTNPTLGSGSSAGGRYMRIGDLVIAMGAINFGTSGVSAGSGNYRISLPVSMRAPTNNDNSVAGHGTVRDSSAPTQVSVSCEYVSATTVNLRVASGALVSEAAPWAWAASDSIRFALMYEAG